MDKNTCNRRDLGRKIGKQVQVRGRRDWQVSESLGVRGVGGRRCECKHGGVCLLGGAA